MSNAGGLGFLAAGYKTADEVALEIVATKRLTEAPFGVNVFVPYQPRVDEVALSVDIWWSCKRRRRGSGRHSVRRCGAMMIGRRSWRFWCAIRCPSFFAFGCPSRDILSAFKRAGSWVVVTITTPKEIVTATAMGVDALCCQGIEAGADRGGFTDDEHDDGFGVLARSLRRDPRRISAHRGRRIGGRTRRRGSARGRCRSCAVSRRSYEAPRVVLMTRTRRHWPIGQFTRNGGHTCVQRSPCARPRRTASCWNIRMLRPHIRRSILRLARFEMTLSNEAIPIA